MSYAFIPARGGSVRIPRKNHVDVRGETLIARTIRIAVEAGCLPVVSTDDDEIAQASLDAWSSTVVHRVDGPIGVPPWQIEDEIALWLPDYLDPSDVIVMLHPTSPFRTVATVRACIDLARAHGSALTVHRSPDAYFGGYLLEAGGIPCVGWLNDRADGRPRSQDLDTVAENGCVYAFTRAHFDQHRSRMSVDSIPVVIGRIEAFEINSLEDLRIAWALA